MVTGATDAATVLFVEDDETLLETFSKYLSRFHDVTAVQRGERALSILEERGGTFDVVVLDRRLPDVSGDELLDRIGTLDLECRVAMVTAVDPDFDLIDMGCDDYLTKPVAPSNVDESIRRLLALDEYDDLYRELSEKRVKRSVLASEKSNAQLKRSDEFAQLEAEIADLERELDEMEETFEDAEVRLPQ